MFWFYYYKRVISSAPYSGPLSAAAAVLCDKISGCIQNKFLFLCDAAVKGHVMHDNETDTHDDIRIAPHRESEERESSSLLSLLALSASVTRLQTAINNWIKIQTLTIRVGNHYEQVKQ